MWCARSIAVSFCLKMGFVVPFFVKFNRTIIKAIHSCVAQYNPRSLQRTTQSEWNTHLTSFFEKVENFFKSHPVSAHRCFDSEHNTEVLQAIIFCMLALNFACSGPKIGMLMHDGKLVRIRTRRDTVTARLCQYRTQKRSSPSSNRMVNTNQVHAGKRLFLDPPTEIRRESRSEKVWNDQCDRMRASKHHPGLQQLLYPWDHDGTYHNTVPEVDLVQCFCQLLWKLVPGNSQFSASKVLENLRLPLWSTTAAVQAAGRPRGNATADARRRTSHHQDRLQRSKCRSWSREAELSVNRIRTVRRCGLTYGVL